MTLPPLGPILMVSALMVATSQSVQIKTWNFTLPNGTLRISLEVDPDGRSGFGIGPGAPTVEPVKAGDRSSPRTVAGL